MKLSVCIPVYNCGKFLGAALDTILPQVAEDMEVVVVDGGSTDATEPVARAYAARSSRMRYVRLPARGGIDADIAQAVALAHGEYCWLFSGDDRMRAGAIAELLPWLERGDDVYLCRHT